MYVKYQPYFMPLDLFCKQLVLLWWSLLAIRVMVEKNYFSVENCNVPLCIPDFTPLYCSWGLLSICTLDYTLNFSSFPKYLALTLQTKVSNFPSLFWLRTTKNKDCLFTSLEGTIPGPCHYPNGSQTSGLWNLGSHPSTSWHCKPAGDLKLKLTGEEGGSFLGAS